MVETTHIEFKSVFKDFAGTGRVLENFDLSIQTNDFVALLGASGSGKSTILRLVAGLEESTSGQIHLSKNSQTFDRAYVFQDSHLMPWRTVIQNVELPLELMNINKSQRHERALKALRSVGLNDAASRLPRELSGGMKMRVSLARAMVVEPKLLLLDEPFAALDEQTRYFLGEELRRLWQKNKMTVLFVTHSVSEATFLANRALVLSPRPAHIVADLTIDMPVDRPASLRTSAQYNTQVQKISETFNRANPREVKP